MKTQRYKCENCGDNAIDWKGNPTTSCPKCETSQEQIDDLRKSIEQEVSSSTMDLINELVNAEILLEQECNK